MVMMTLDLMVVTSVLENLLFFFILTKKCKVVKICNKETN